MLGMLFGYFIIYLLGAITILISLYGLFVIRYNHRIDDPFVVHNIIAWEIFWLIAVLSWIFFPDFWNALS